jgi:hypothetical protein
MLRPCNWLPTAIRSSWNNKASSLAHLQTPHGDSWSKSCRHTDAAGARRRKQCAYTTAAAPCPPRLPNIVARWYIHNHHCSSSSSSALLLHTTLVAADIVRCNHPCELLEITQALMDAETARRSPAATKSHEVALDMQLAAHCTLQPSASP